MMVDTKTHYIPMSRIKTMSESGGGRNENVTYLS